MATETDIANLALGHIGAPSIMSLTDRASKSAREVNRIYDHTVAEVGRMHNWNCLMKRDFGALQTVAPKFGYANQFKLPDDFLKLAFINDLDADRNKGDYWDIEGNLLLCSADETRLRYVAHIRDTVVYDANFIACLSYYMGSKLATPIRQDDKKAQALFLTFTEVILPDAKKTDGNEGHRPPSDYTKGSGYISSRRVSTKG